MTARHPALYAADTLPRVWLMTDARNDVHLEKTIARLPERSGIIFRHYHLAMPERRARFDQLHILAHKYGHLILLANDPALAHKWGADGFHGRERDIRNRGKLLYTAPVHNISEARIARQRKADMVFISPVFATASHPGARAMSRQMLVHLITQSNVPAVLLGGMTADRFERLKSLGAHGWAAIDGLTRS